MVGETANPASEFIVLGHQPAATSKCSDLPPNSDCIPNDFYGHQGGGLQFASDGTLFVSIGDSSSWDVVDDRALRAQDLTTYSGKLLHITATGKGMSTNPFWTGNADDVGSKIYVDGFRNPFRITLDPTTGVPYVGDVGWVDWEEVDKIVAGGNYGWPCYEGNGQQSGYVQEAACQTLYAQGASAVKLPLLTYSHASGGAAVTGGVFLKGTSFPSMYQNDYLFGDYARNYIHYLDLDANGDIESGGGEQGFATAADGPVDFTVGPDGAVYYVAILSGEVRRLAYQASGGPTYVSDLSFTSATNGLGPFERDSSNGADQPGDGGTITVSGVQYAKGLGVAAPLQIEFAVPAGCTSFSAVAGIDDEVGDSGSVHFTVGNGANPLFQSPLITGASACAEHRRPALQASRPCDSPLTTGATATPSTTPTGPTPNSTVERIRPRRQWSRCRLRTRRPASVSRSRPLRDSPSLWTLRLCPRSTVKLTTSPGGVAVAGTVTYDDTARSVTFTPSAALTANSSYQLQIIGGASGIADLAGNHLATTATSTFTTGTASATTRYVSDMTWGTATNGWGAPERDRSNGEQGDTDGGPIRVAGTHLSQRHRGARQLDHPCRPHRAQLHPLPIRHRHRRRSRQPRHGPLPGLERHHHNAHPIRRHHRRISHRHHRYQHHRHQQPAPRRHRQRRRQRLRPRRLGRRQTHLRRQRLIGADDGDRHPGCRLDICRGRYGFVHRARHGE